MVIMITKAQEMKDPPVMVIPVITPLAMPSIQKTFGGPKEIPGQVPTLQMQGLILMRMPDHFGMLWEDSFQGLALRKCLPMDQKFKL